MKKNEFLLKFLLSLLMVVGINNAFAQIEAKATPPSFYFETENIMLSTTEHLPITFDVASMRTEDETRKLDNLPPRIGITIPVNFTTANSGEWTLLPNGQDIWRLCIVAENAIAIMLLYDKFDIPVGGKLFIYNHDRSMVMGAYSEKDNPKRVEFSTEFIAGDIITLEYLAPAITDYETPIKITGVGYGYNNLHIEKQDGDDQTEKELRVGACEVNINCPEGYNWQDQKKGVARIIIPASGGYIYYCSGSLVNNTRGDLDPLFLSAYHCYEGATAAQVNQSQYFFHYEYLACNGGGSATQKTITGASILVNIPYNNGSDGTLLRLNNSIPSNFDVYYNGWDRRNVAATSGVGIHHPDGSRKKISTFTNTLTQSYCIGAMPMGASWQVKWAPTETNHGVTEGGSSGSPLFNQDKLIVGTLSGGTSECIHPYWEDCYGKVWYHWNQHATQKMQTYLDPDNTGAEFIEGIYDCYPPKNLTVNYINDCEAKLEWETPPINDITYNVYRDNILLVSNISVTSYTDKDFTPTESHIWAVSVMCNEEDESGKMSVNKESCIPVYNVKLSAEPKAGGNVTGSGVYQENEEATATAIPKANFIFINWTKNNVEVSKENPYIFKVTENVELVANFKDITGIPEIGTDIFFTFYPNPAGSQLNVVKTNVGNAQVTIYNNIGLVVQSFEIIEKETAINISTLSAGIYFIRLMDSNNSSTQSFVKE